MNNLGSLSLVVHIVIIVVNEIKKLSKKRLISLFIILVILMSVSISATLAIKSSLEGESNISYFANLLYRCKSFETGSGGNKVVLRIDDIQAFAWKEISRISCSFFIIKAHKLLY